MANLANTEWHRLFDGPTIPIMLLIAAAAVTIIATVASIQWRQGRVAERMRPPSPGGSRGATRRARST